MKQFLIMYMRMKVLRLTNGGYRYWNNTTDVNSGAGNAYHFGAPECCAISCFMLSDL